MYRALPVRANAYSGGYAGAVVEDAGIRTLTAGEGKVFAVGRFLPSSFAYRPGIARIRPRQVQGLADNSVLAAFSVAGEGRLVWQVGDGGGNADVLRSSKFLTAPTYWAGRLYVVAEHMQAYHLICLSADRAR